MRRTVLLKDSWQFKKVDSRKWTTVRIPHDFAARENFDRDSDISFSIHNIRGKQTVVERPGNTGGLPFCGKFIYRKEIEIDSLGKEEMARLEFDGVHGAYRQSSGLLPLVAAVYGAAGNGLSHRRSIELALG